MLQAHSFLWHYLWVGPHVLLLILAFFFGDVDRHAGSPPFCLRRSSPALELPIRLDVLPFVLPKRYGTSTGQICARRNPQVLLIGEIFAFVFGAYTSLARLGTILIRGVGIILVLTAALAAAYAPQDSLFGIVSGAHLLEQTIYLIETGLLVFIFVFSAYFMSRPRAAILGIALGLAISACVHLATWGIAANSGAAAVEAGHPRFHEHGHLSHLCPDLVLLPAGSQESRREVCGPLPENNLDVWNRELERLVHQ